MKSPRLRSLPQKYSPKSILRDITTYFEDSVFPIREINEHVVIWFFFKKLHALIRIRHFALSFSLKKTKGQKGT